MGMSTNHETEEVYMVSIYDFTVRDREGKDVSLADYKGKVLIIVNTATECGFTPTYADLQKLYERDKDKDLEILDFPCNQFGQQAPGLPMRSTASARVALASPFRSLARLKSTAKGQIPSSSGSRSRRGLRALTPRTGSRRS